VIGVRTNRDPENWRIPVVKRVSAEVDRINVRGTPVLSWWPGYLVESSERIVPGMENHFGIAVAEKLSAERRARLHILSESDVRSLLAAERPLVILGNWVNRTEYAQVLQDLDYAPEVVVEGTTIYGKGGAPAAGRGATPDR
jgi:hypothetical protein